jgi:hypothetical protein
MSEYTTLGYRRIVLEFLRVTGNVAHQHPLKGHVLKYKINEPSVVDEETLAFFSGYPYLTHAIMFSLSRTTMNQLHGLPFVKFSCHGLPHVIH